MCEFCHRHGEGKKWYLSTANYAEGLFTEAAKRSVRDTMEPFRADGRPQPQVSPTQRFVFQHAHRVALWVARRHQQAVHWGQVVPLEDAFQVIDMLDWIVRLPCVCRVRTTGDRNARFCFGIGMAPIETKFREVFQDAVGSELSLETVTKEQAKAALTDLDHRGAMHSVWTFAAPFIGGLCNCDGDCGAYRAHTVTKYPVMFRAEYLARVDPDKCNGCKRCMHQCLWGAMRHSLHLNKCEVNRVACYGCGVCRSACSRDAITLVERAAVPAAAARWEL